MNRRTYQIVRVMLATVALAALASTQYRPLQVRAGSTGAAAPLASAGSVLSFQQPRVTDTSGRQASDSRVEFEENRGQFDKQVRFVGRAGGSTVFLTATGAVYVLPMPQNSLGQESFALRMKLVGANADSSFTGEAKREHRTNYFRGNNPENWYTNIPNFSRVRYEGVYDGVALVWHGQEQGVTQYDFVVQPNADAGKIELEFAGADSLETDSDGNLLIHTKAGVVKHGRPFSYQEARGQRAEVASSFVVENNRVRFSVAGYDKSKPLTIDPSVDLSNLAFATFLGGEAVDTSDAIAVDRAGSVYLTGQTQSLLFPTVVGGFDTSHTNQAVFVTKMNAIGTDLIYSTYLDGAAIDAGFAIAVDASGNAYVTGSTDSSDFPTTAANAFDTSLSAQTDVFATKLNATGSALSYSTYLGGAFNDSGRGIAVDSAGNAYVTGSTASTDFPTTAGAFDTSLNNAAAGLDVFVSKINPSLSGAASLVYSTYIGGAALDFGAGIAVDSSGNAYIIGNTSSTDYPTTAGVFDTVANGGTDVFVTKVNTGGTALTYSTYVGGDSNDDGTGIAVDSAGQAYITGNTINGTTDFPTTASGFDITHNGLRDVFATKLNATGTLLVYSTFLGGSDNDFGKSIAVDSSGFVYITGDTVDGATDYPTTAGAFDTTHNGTGDVFVTKLRPTGGPAQLTYSTFIGSSVNDDGNGLAVDSSGNVYVTGDVDSTTAFPVTAEAFQPLYNGGGSDGFVFKLGNFAITGRAIDSGSGNPTANVMVGMSGHTSNFMLTGPDGRFSFTNTLNSTPYSVAASRANLNINPSIFNIASLDSNRDLIFLAQSGQPTSTQGGISGQIEQTDGTPLAGVLIQLGGAQSRKTMTDASGKYQFADVVTNGLYTVRPSQPNFSFSPAERTFSQLGENTKAVFTGSPIASGLNVIDTAEYFVRQQYVDFLEREPDESGFNFWSDQILECGTDVGCLERRRINVSAAYFLSIEFQETGGLVDGLYRASFGRRPIYVEFVPDSYAIAQGVIVGRDGWEQQLETNKQEFIDAWVQRSVFHATYDGSTNDGYVDQLIAHTGVSYPASERAGLVAGLTDGTLTRAAVLRQIVENRGFIRAKFNQTFVMMQYFGYLRRDPDESGYQFWLAKLNQFNGNFEQAEMVKAFLVSAEYRQRFGP